MAGLPFLELSSALGLQEEVQVTLDSPSSSLVVRGSLPPLALDSIFLLSSSNKHLEACSIARPAMNKRFGAQYEAGVE